MRHFFSCLHTHSHAILVLVAHTQQTQQGGYAGDAAGFKIMSLLKLPEIRANKPGISLIHFVAHQTELMSQTTGSADDADSAAERRVTLSQFHLQLPSLEEASK